MLTPSRLQIPLAQMREKPARPVVEAGQSVKTATLLADSVDDGPRVHSPVAGVVRGFACVDTPYQQGVSAIEIETTPPGQAEVLVGLRTVAAWPEPAELVAAAKQHGVLLPDAAALQRQSSVDTVIVSGLDPAPRQTANVRTTADYAELVAFAAARLHEALGARRTEIIVSRTRRDLAAVLRGLCRDKPLRVRMIANRYPQAHPHLLVTALTGREVRANGTPLDCGVWVVDALTLMDLYRAVACRSPIAWHTLTVFGDAVLSPGNYRVPLGMSVRQIMERAGLSATPRRVIVGGWLNGVSVPSADVVLTRATRCLTVQRGPRRAHPQPTACIRCGACIEICPVGLDPRALHELAELGTFDPAARLHPQACIDCGLCDYVCPSALPLRWGVHRCREHASAK